MSEVTSRWNFVCRPPPAREGNGCCGAEVAISYVHRLRFTLSGLSSQPRRIKFRVGTTTSERGYIDDSVETRHLQTRHPKNVSLLSYWYSRI